MISEPRDRKLTPIGETLFMSGIHLYAEPTTDVELRELADNDRLYAVVDACGEPAVPERARAMEWRAGSLWQGRPDEPLWAIAPYLFQVDEPTLAWIRDSLGRSPWGIFLRASRPRRFGRLVTHLQRFVESTLDGERRYYFRFYDPRVVEPFLQSCTDSELASFLGPFEAVGVSDFILGGTCWWRVAGGSAMASGRWGRITVRGTQ